MSLPTTLKVAARPQNKAGRHPLHLISPLFLPAPQLVLHQMITVFSPRGCMDATLWQHLAASLGRHGCGEVGIAMG